MEEIDLVQLFNYFKSKWFYILFAVSLAFCVSSIYVNQFRQLEYTSYTKIILNQASTSETISNQDINLNQSLVPDYTEIIKSKLVLNQVNDLLDLNMEYEDLVKKISVSGVNGTSVIKISVTDVDPNLACDIASTIANVFMKEVGDIYKLDNISVLDEAEVSVKSSSTSALKIIAIAIVVGAVISCGVIFVFFYFDTTIKDEDMIENAVGIPVIGTVPYDEKQSKKPAKTTKAQDTTSEVIVEKVRKEATDDKPKRVTRSTSAKGEKVVAKRTRIVKK